MVNVKFTKLEGCIGREKHRTTIFPKKLSAIDY